MSSTRPVDPDSRVECHAGASYPERPTAFLWNGCRREVSAVTREWREPGRKVFSVDGAHGGRFRLDYNEGAGTWSVTRDGES